MRLPVLLAAALLSLPALAADRTYAVMSIAGDGLLVVTREVSVGSLIDKNRREVLPLKSPALDNAALLTIEEAIKQEEPSARTLLLGGRIASVIELQRKMLQENGSLAPVVEAVREAASKAGATHLLLVTKLRDEARLRVVDGSIGAGRVEGFGFYVDELTRTSSTATGSGAQGFIAPFVYLRLSLVELSSGKVVAEELVRDAQVVASQNSPVAWDALLPEEKIRMLKHLMAEEMRHAIPKLMKK